MIERLFGLRAVIVGAGLLYASFASAVTIDFTGGTVHFVGGGTATTNNSAQYDNVSHYEEAGFKLEFIFDTATPDPFSANVGDYYHTGNDVFHAHWAGNGNQPTGPYGNVTEIRVSKTNGTTFDLGGFRVSTNTACGGCASDGNEMTWVNSSKASNIFLVDSDSWGLGAGPDPLISIAAGNTLFDDISWFSFTNDALSSAVGLGLDNFFLDESGDPGGTDPTPTPAPAAILLFALGLLGLRLRK